MRSAEGRRSVQQIEADHRGQNEKVVHFRYAWAHPNFALMQGLHTSIPLRFFTRISPQLFRFRCL